MVIAFLVVLGPLILIHEFGHFIAAKRAGIRVIEFGMGYPPRALRLWRGQGSITIGSRTAIIPRNFKLPKTLDNGKLARAVAVKNDEVLILKSIVVLDEQPADAPVPAEFTLDEARLYGEVSELDPGTEYTLNWLPLGGFVRMYGEEGLSGKGSFNDASKRWRTITLLAGPGMNLLTALVVFSVTFMAGWPSVPIRIKDVQPNSPAAQAGLLPNDAIVSIGGQPTREVAQLEDYLSSITHQSIALTIDRNGQQFTANLPQAAAGGASGIDITDERPELVKSVSAGSPAERAGLRANDLIVAVDGDALRQSGQLHDYVVEHAGQAVVLTVSRNGQRSDISIVPRTPDQIPAGQGAMGILLNESGYYLVPYPLGASIGNSIDEMANTVQQIASLPARLLSRAAAPNDARVMGPVGISQVAGVSLQETLDTGQLFWTLSLIAQISLALGITNLLPLPALDGGRMLFVLIEAVRRKRIPPEREAIVHLVGMALLLGLMVLITIQDISNPIIRN